VQLFATHLGTGICCSLHHNWSPVIAAICYTFGGRYLLLFASHLVAGICSS